VPATITHRIAATFTPARDDQVPLADAYPDRSAKTAAPSTCGVAFACTAMALIVGAVPGTERVDLRADAPVEKEHAGMSVREVLSNARYLVFLFCLLITAAAGHAVVPRGDRGEHCYTRRPSSPDTQIHAPSRTSSPTSSRR
jgi:hypothetical protein